MLSLANVNIFYEFYHSMLILFLYSGHKSVLHVIAIYVLNIELIRKTFTQKHTVNFLSFIVDDVVRQSGACSIAYAKQTKLALTFEYHL